MIIVQSKNDSVLKVLVGELNVNSKDRDFDGIEEHNNDAIGACHFDFKNAVKIMDKSKAPFNKWSDDEIITFLKTKISIIDVSELSIKDKKKKIKHNDYMKNEIFVNICGKVKPLLNKFE